MILLLTGFCLGLAFGVVFAEVFGPLEDGVFLSPLGVVDLPLVGVLGSLDSGATSVPSDKPGARDLLPGILFDRSKAKS